MEAVTNLGESKGIQDCCILWAPELTMALIATLPYPVARTCAKCAATALRITARYCAKAASRKSVIEATASVSVAPRKTLFVLLAVRKMKTIEEESSET